MAKGRPVPFWLGWGLLAVVAAVAALAPLLAPYDPRLPTGRPLTGATAEHPLGTNDLGQDVLSQLVSGARASLVVAGVVTAASTVLSWLVGAIAGVSRRAEAPLMLGTDLLLALPSIPLALLVLTLLGPSQHNLILVLVVLSWPPFARIVRSIVLRARSAAYVEASRAMGATDTQIVLRHLLPATLAVLPTKLVLTVRFAVFAEAMLAFLGLGGGDSISWGMMLNWAFADPLLFSRPVWPWLVLPPTLAIVALILAITWIGGNATGSRSLPLRHRAGERHAPVLRRVGSGVSRGRATALVQRPLRYW